MDEVIPGLWVGDLPSALNVENLKAKNIRSVLTAMRGRISIHPTLMRYQINLDDEEEADVLTHLVGGISFIEAELEKGHGVLVHCQAGISRSATIAAAYLMYARNMDASTALELIKKARPNIQPNDGFLRQLDIFYKASFKVSRRDKTVRMFYLERAVEEMMNGDGEIETDMFARYPRTPSDSVPPTPGGPHRRIRCKMCRTELARREHMMDHGQIGPATPAVAFSPVASRRPSMHDYNPLLRRGSTNERRQSGTQPRSRLGSVTDAAPTPRRPSAGAAFARGLSEQLSMSSIQNNDVFEDDSTSEAEEGEGPSEKPRSRSGSNVGLKKRGSMVQEGMALGRRLSDSLHMTPMEKEKEKEKETKGGTPSMEVEDPPSVLGAPPTPPRSRLGSSGSTPRPAKATLRPEGVSSMTRTFSDSLSMTSLKKEETEDAAEDEEMVVASPPAISRRGSQRRQSQSTLPQISEVRPLNTNAEAVSDSSSSQRSSMEEGAPQSKPNRPPLLSHGSDLAAQLFANPKLAALRGSIGGMTPITSPTSTSKPQVPTPAPILINSKCSGYFLEPMKWMEPFLEQGQLAGKIVCPNKKCGAKLGNYDWAGVCCSCKEWVVPGFCIHRSKVDEVV